jgi:ribosome biogenesis GTPase
LFSLEELGYCPFYAVQLPLFEGSDKLVPARVTASSHGFYELAGCGVTEGELSGRLRRSLKRKARPTTGDWVAVAVADGKAVIHHLLERQTVLQRRAAGSMSEAQVVAANADVFFVVTSANLDLNPRRLERYLTAV